MICKQCGKEFVGKTSRAQFCSASCRARFFYLRDRDKILARAKGYRDRNHTSRVAWERAYWSSEPRRAARNKRVQHRHQNPMVRLRVLVYGAKTRCNKSGIKFDSGILQEITSIIPIVCPCCREPLDYSVGGRIHSKWRSPSLDRTDPTMGYVLGNVVVLCHRCNSLKSNATVDELRTIVRYLESLHTLVPQYAALEDQIKASQTPAGE